jgi:hypothetical protein
MVVSPPLTWSSIFRGQVINSFIVSENTTEEFWMYVKLTTIFENCYQGMKTNREERRSLTLGAWRKPSAYGLLVWAKKERSFCGTCAPTQVPCKDTTPQNYFWKLVAYPSYRLNLHLATSYCGVTGRALRTKKCLTQWNGDSRGKSMCAVAGSCFLSTEIEKMLYHCAKISQSFRWLCEDGEYTHSFVPLNEQS